MPLDPSPEYHRTQDAMAVPKRRTSHARQGKRRSHQHLKPIQIQYCPQCNEAVLPHRVCPNCGHYQGREVVAEEEK
jgi:large subunit ribosomal protein L32